MNNHVSMRQEILDYAFAEYGTEPEYLWKDSPNCAVLRHSSNNKWYGIIMDVPKSRLGLTENDDTNSSAKHTIDAAVDVDVVDILTHGYMVVHCFLHF